MQAAFEERQGPDGSGGKRPEEKARRWLEAAVDARDEAFGEFIQTAQEISLAASVGGRPEQVAHAITALVDGLIFQFVEERVGEDWSTEKKVGYTGEVVGLLIGGLLPRT